MSSTDKTKTSKSSNNGTFMIDKTKTLPSSSNNSSPSTKRLASANSDSSSTHKPKVFTSSNNDRTKTPPSSNNDTQSTKKMKTFESSNTIDKTNTSASSITIIPSGKKIIHFAQGGKNPRLLHFGIPNSLFHRILDAPSDPFIKNFIKQKNILNSNTCQYYASSPSTNSCKNHATYTCPHCSILYCLQHGLKHQEELKGDVRSLLTKAQVKFLSNKTK